MVVFELAVICPTLAVLTRRSQGQGNAVYWKYVMPSNTTSLVLGSTTTHLQLTTSVVLLFLTYSFNHPHTKVVERS